MVYLNAKKIKVFFYICKIINIKYLNAMKLVFATNNKNKLYELQKILGDKIEIVSLSDIDFHEDIPEDHETLEENALQKALYIKDKFGLDCFADDTGLEVEALNNRPGVYSARYAGEAKDSEKNMDKILQELQDKDNRKAHFRTVIALVLDGTTHLFEGRVDGEILRERHGTKGFGYDPIFQPQGYNLSFSEMGVDEKNKISHRAKAVEKLCEFLNSIHNR